MTAVALTVKGPPPDIAAIESVLIEGDLARLTQDQRVSYYKLVCESVGLNPLTQPFAYLRLNGALRLYARKDCTDQLRRVHGVSVVEATDATVKDVHVVTVKVQDKHGRTDVAKGAVSLGGLSGENLANAIMKAETKAKRRATLSICGLGLLDEVEVESVPGAETEPQYTPPARAKPAPKAETSAPAAAATVAPTSAAASGAGRDRPKGEAPGMTPATGGSAAKSAEGSAPSTAGPAALAPHEDPEWVELVQRVRELMLKYPDPVEKVEGLGWNPKHAESWLLKYFGRKRPIDLTKPQATDACLLVMTRLRTPELYPMRLEQFHAEQRILTADYDKAEFAK